MLLAIRVLAGLIVIGAGVVLFATENSRLLSVLVIGGALLTMAADYWERRS